MLVEFSSLIRFLSFYMQKLISNNFNHQLVLSEHFLHS